MTSSHRDGTGWLDGVLVLAVLGLAGLLGCVVIRNSDIWMHFATGRLIANGEFKFGVDPFCHTTIGETWINNAWGWDLGLYWLFQQFGGTGVVLTRLAMVLVTTGFLLIHRRPGGGLAIPAMLTALALIAANGRLPIMQSTLWSYMCLAILMWLLHSGPRWITRWLLPVGVILLHIYWVNHDAWFFVGPIVVALWAIGSLFETRKENDPSLGFYFGLLVCALLGCLANPYHYRAFVVPDDLFPTFMEASISGHPFFESLQLPIYDSGVRANQPAPTYASYGLALLGLTSFALNLPRPSFRRLLIWLFLIGITCWRARLLPFFAIGTAPLVVLNLQDFFANRLEPSAHLRMVGITIRSVAALAVIGLGFAAWPGWLGPTPGNPLRVNRVGLRIEHDTSAEKLSVQLNELQAAGKLPTSERAFAGAPEMPHYMAWFAPKLKSFIDSRWRLHAVRLNDFLAAKQFFAKLESNQRVDMGDLAKALKPYSIGFFVFNGSDRSRGTTSNSITGPARLFFTNPDRFPFLASSGKATAFAWNDTQQPGHSLVDAAQLAFAPQAAPRLAAVSDDGPKVQTAWEQYVHGTKPTPTELETVAVWQDFTESNMMRNNIGMEAAAIASLTANGCTAPSYHLRTMVGFHPATASAPSRILAPDRMAGAVLSVRHSRASLAADNDNAEAAYRLATSYTRMASVESMLTLQYAAALTHARSRLETFAANGWDESQVGFLVARDLAQYHSQLGLDLLVENARLVQEMMRRPSVMKMFADPKAYEAEFNGRKKQLEGLEKKLAEQREKLDTDPKSPPIQRMARAEQLGLSGDALAIFQKVLTDRRDQLNIQDFAYAINLMLKVGRAEDARAVLNSPNFNPVTAVEPAMQPFFHRLHLNAAVAVGDYQRAREEFSVLLDINRLDLANSAQGAAFSFVSAGIALDPVAAPLLSRAMLSPIWHFFPTQQLNAVHAQRFELLAWQTVIALEEGDTRAAKRSVDEALDGLPANLRPPGWELLTSYKILLDRAAQGNK